MDFSSETLYQIVRILFAISLLGFLFLVIRVTLRELGEPLARTVSSKTQQQRAQFIVVTGEEGSNVPDGGTTDFQGVATLGRAQSAHVVLDDPSVSAQHALIRPADGRWTIEDLGSRNGTMVNGRLIVERTDLQCGDAIQLGRVRLRLLC